MSSSKKLKSLLEDKERLYTLQINKLKTKMNIIKINSVSTSVLSILISSVIATTFLPTMAISILLVCSTVLIGINLTFKFQDKNLELKRAINKYDKIRLKLKYINSLNGNLTKAQFYEIFKEFNTVL